jgi:hypothetical protein
VAHTGTAADALRIALYFATATINKTIAEYTTTGEITGTGYVAAGNLVTNDNSPQVTNDVAHWTPSADVTFAGLTETAFDCALLYNDSEATKRSIAVFTFGSQTIVAGNFVLTMPVDDESTGLLRLS